MVRQGAEGVSGGAGEGVVRGCRGTKRNAGKCAGIFLFLAELGRIEGAPQDL